MKIEFGAVVDTLSGLVWTTHEDGRSDFVNRQWRGYTGLGAVEALGHGWKTAVHPEDLTSFVRSWEGIRESGSAGEIDARLRRFDGEFRWFVFRPSPLPDDDGSPRRWCWLGLDADESAATDGRLRRLFDMMPIQAGFLNPAMVLEFANRQSLRDFNMTFAELDQWTTSGIIHGDDHQRNSTNITSLLTTGQMMDQEIRMLYPDGAYRWTRARCVPVRDAQGNAVRYVTCQIDVDNLKRAEALLAAEVRLLGMVARGETLAQILDVLTGRVEDLCSSCLCSALIVAPDRSRFQIGARSSLPDACFDVFDGETIASAGDPCSLSVIKKVPVVAADIANDPRWQNSRWLRVMKDLGFDSCCAMPVISVSGEVSGVVAVYRSRPAPPSLQKHEEDLIDRFTKIAGIAIDRAEAGAALETRERELREALAQLSEGQRLSRTGSFTSDIRQDRHHWSDEFYRIFEIDRAMPPLLGTVRDRVHPDDLPAFNMEMRRRFEGEGGDFGFRVVTPTGGVKHLRGVSQVIEHIAGRPIFMGTIQDITESKVAEEALNQARSELAHVARVATLNAMTASIAHEVSQPLSGILTNANTCVRFLASDPPNLAGAAETARRTIRDANRATDVIQRLRAMFSTKAPAMETADLNDVAREVIALSMGELRRAGALLETGFAERLPPVSVDRVQLQQVILNLLLNAADAMAGVENRPRTLLVRTGLHDDGGIHLLVRDSGIGLDPANVGKLFDAFYTTKPKGMGVGLSISRSIIQRHNGRLWAEPNEGFGATFSFCLPSASVQP